MYRKLVASAVVLGAVSVSSLAFALDDNEVILKILIKKGIVTQQEVDEMRTEVAKEKATAKVVVPKDLEERVSDVEKGLLSKAGLEKLSSRLTFKGRYAAGYFDSQKKGAYPNGSFQIPDVKAQFIFLPDDINAVIMRLSLNNAAFNSVDYLYLDTNIMKLTPWEESPFTLSSRLGRMKIDFGEETWTNNPIDNILPSNSAANVTGYDEGLQLSGKIGRERPLGWALGLANGNSGTGLDTDWAKAFSAKVSYNPIDPLYISGSYYNSGSLGAASSELSIAGITAPPTYALNWNRQIVEADVRYDIEKGRVVNPPAYCDSLAFVRGTYGYFYDSASALDTRNTANRQGSYGAIEGMYNITPKFYTAGRASIIGLAGTDHAASLNNVACNLYERYSLGLGYRLTNAMLLKGSYDINLQKKGTGGEDPKDGLLSILMAGHF